MGAGERMVDAGAVALNVAEAGEGPLVVLLHGFPEFHGGWRHQIPALVDAGFRVVAPDQRGYGLSDKPARVGDYRVEALAADVAGLIEACGEQRAHVVGHDWGALVAWGMAMWHPEMVSSLSILNVPHPQRLQAALTRPSRQMLRSWYAMLFQIPRLPEMLLSAGGYRAMAQGFADARPGAFTAEDLDRYRAAWSRPGALTAMLAWYRAAVRRDPRASRAGWRTIKAPTLVIWGERDRFIEASLAEPDPAWVPRARVERLPAASHWVQHDEPDRVNALLIEHLRSDP